MLISTWVEVKEQHQIKWAVLIIQMPVPIRQGSFHEITLADRLAFFRLRQAMEQNLKLAPSLLTLGQPSLVFGSPIAQVKFSEGVAHSQSAICLTMVMKSLMSS